LERGIDRVTLGAFFVHYGKEQVMACFPISETVLALSICRQVVIECLESGAELDNPVKLYQAIGTSSDVAELFMLGCFYVTKGALEAIYEGMNENDNISQALLKKYFKDDFFFKREQE
jgi:hypothetical protein